MLNTSKGQASSLGERCWQAHTDMFNLSATTYLDFYHQKGKGYEKRHNTMLVILD